MKKHTQVIDMIDGPLLPNVIRFALPVMLSALLEMLFNAADTIIVGKFSGQQALAAVGSTGSVIFLMTSLFNGLASGTNVVIAKYLGSNNFKKVEDAVHTAIFTALLGGILVLIIGSLSTTAFLRWMNAPEDIIGLSALYMHIYWFGAPFMLMYDFGAAILRSKGDTRRPFIFLTMAGVLNVFLNIIFVVIFKLSVIGVATATVISMMLCSFLIIQTLRNEEDAMCLDLKKLSLHKDILIEILKIGIPAGIQGIIFAFTNIVIQSEVNKLGSTVVAGNSAAVNIEDFVYIGMIGFSQAAVTFTSQNVGAKKISRIPRIMVVTMILNVSVALAIGALIMSQSHLFMSFYTDDIGVIEAGAVRLRYVTFLLWINAVMDIFVCSLRGMGRSMLPTMVSLIGITGIRLWYIYFYYPKIGTLSALYQCFPLSWIITSLIQGLLWIIVYTQFKKQHRMVEEI